MNQMKNEISHSQNNSEIRLNDKNRGKMKQCVLSNHHCTEYPNLKVPLFQINRKNQLRINFEISACND